MKSALLLLLPLVACFTSCVPVLPPEQAPYTPARSTVSPVGLVVVDDRSYVLDEDKSEHYIGRIRGAYGIPASVNDPQVTFSDRIAGYAEAGLSQKGAKVVKTSVSKGTASSEVAKTLGGQGARKIVVIRLKDVWADFANALWSKNSLLYFDVEVEVLTPDGRVIAKARRKNDTSFQYSDGKESPYNHMLRSLQPEFKKLLAAPPIQTALAP